MDTNALMKRWFVLTIMSVISVIYFILIYIPTGSAQSPYLTITPNPNIVPLTYPTAEASNSIFPQDTCVPPCWFGLVPGESGAEEVATFVQEANILFSESRGVTVHRSNIFDKEEGYLIGGSYNFYWPEYLQRSAGNNSLILRDGILEEIWVYADRSVHLGQALEILGPPSSVRLGFLPYALPSLVFVYDDMRLLVLFLDGSRNECAVVNLDEHFEVDSLYYYSPEAWSTNQLYTVGGAFRFVPPEVWQTWLDGRANTDCLETWEQLPETMSTPSPTQSPIPTHEDFP